MYFLASLFFYLILYYSIHSMNAWLAREQRREMAVSGWFLVSIHSTCKVRVRVRARLFIFLHKKKLLRFSHRLDSIFVFVCCVSRNFFSSFRVNSICGEDFSWKKTVQHLICNTSHHITSGDNKTITKYQIFIEIFMKNLLSKKE